MRIITLTILLLFSCSSVSWAAGDAWAILQMIATQTREHQERLMQLRRQVEYLKKASDGLEGVDFITDLRNVIVEGEDFLNDIDDLVRKGKNFSEEWYDIFGDLKRWGDKDPRIIYENIDITDQVNSASYEVGDRFQEAYKQNAEAISRLAANAKNVSEKGALKQISESMAHLLQMQNHIVYLLSQQIKQQSIEYANNNTTRKEELIRIEEENKGVRQFMGLADKGISYK